MRNTNRLQILHGRAQYSRPDGLVSFEFDFADFDLRPFLHHKRKADGSGRNLSHFTADRGELPPMFGKQVLDGNFRLLQTGGIVLTLHHQTHLILLKAIQHVAVGNRTETHVVDGADGGLFFHLEGDAPALGRLLAQNFDIFEITRVPNRVEVAFQGGGVVNVSRLGEDASLDGFGRNAAVAADPNLRNHVRLRPGQACRCQQERGYQPEKRRHTPAHPWPRPLK